MIKGSIPADGGHLIVNEPEYLKLSKIPLLDSVLKKLIGAQEIIDKINRWCLYINDASLKEIAEIPEIRQRLHDVSEMRKKSTKKPTQMLAATPHKFAEDRYFDKPCLLVPCVTSEQRKYIPIAFVESGKNLKRQNKTRKNLKNY
jgi:hypothetical protein